MTALLQIKSSSWLESQPYLWALTTCFRNSYRNHKKHNQKPLIPIDWSKREIKPIDHGDIKSKSSTKSGEASNLLMAKRQKMVWKKNSILWPEPCATSKEYPTWSWICSLPKCKPIPARLSLTSKNNRNSNPSCSLKPSSSQEPSSSRTVFSEQASNSKTRKSTWEQAQETHNSSTPHKSEPTSSSWVNCAQASIPSLDS